MKNKIGIGNRAFFGAALLVWAFAPLAHRAAGQGGAAGAPVPSPHLLQSATCCGMAITVDQTNLASIAECAPGDTSCQQGVAICFADGTCQDLSAGSAASIRFWKKYSVAGLPQRLDTVVGNIYSHASPTSVGWTEAQGAPLP